MGKQVIIDGLLGVNPQEVNSSNQASVISGKTPALAGYTKLVGKYANSPVGAIYDSGRFGVALDRQVFYDEGGGNGSIVNANQWTTSVDTMGITATAANGYWLNSGAITTGSKFAIMTTVPTIAMLGRVPMRTSMDIQLTNLPNTNATAEFGWGACSGVSAPTDGTFFRCKPDGTMWGVVSFNGSETLIQIPAGAVPGDGYYHSYEVVQFHNYVHFYVDATEVGMSILQTPLPTSVTRLPLFARVFNGATPPSSAPQLKMAQTWHTYGGVMPEPPNQWLPLATGKQIAIDPSTFAQVTSYANSAAPASASLSNTVPGYTTLGGQWQFAAVAGAETDYVLFAYQIPATFRLILYGVNISTYNGPGATGSATVPTLMQWALGVNATAASIATADSLPNTVGPRRIFLGSQCLEASALQGQIAKSDGTLQTDFTQCPVYCDSGRYISIILKMPVAAATSSQIIRGTVSFEGCWE